MNNQYAYLSFGQTAPSSAPETPETSFSFGMQEDAQSYAHPQYPQTAYPYYPHTPSLQTYPQLEMMNPSGMFTMPNQSYQEEDELLRDLFTYDKPQFELPSYNNDAQQYGVMLPQNLVEQILSTDNNQDSTSVLEMLRNNIMSSIEAQQVPAPDTRPAIKTESIQNEKKEKKGGVKKRRYVKSGLYRKDKNGNFIYSSSDRARLAQVEENNTESTQQQQPEQDAQQSVRVKRPLNAYNIFCKLHFDQVKTENPELSINELSKLMGEKWKGMSASQKKVYYDKVEHGQTRYKKPLNSYNLYCKKNFDALKKEFPNKSIHVLSKVIAERWKKLSESEKRVYYDEAERQKQQQGQQQEKEEPVPQQQDKCVEDNSFGQQPYAPELNFDAFF